MLFTVSVPKFAVSICLIRNFTMFSLVKTLCTEKQRSSHPYSAVMFFSLIQFEVSPTGTLYSFFHVALAFKRKHSLKCVVQKKKSYIHPQGWLVARGHIAMFWTCVIWWLMMTLLAQYLIYLWFYWTTRNHKDCRNSDSGCQYSVRMMQKESHTSSQAVLLCPLAPWWSTCQ